MIFGERCFDGRVIVIPSRSTGLGTTVAPANPKISPRLVETRVLDPSNLPSIYESHCADHHCLLRTGSNDDLVWMTARTSVITQISCERFAQVGIATA